MASIWNISPTNTSSENLACSSISRISLLLTVLLGGKVRDNADDITEFLAKGNFSHRLDKSIFIKTNTDEIILSLNYDGLYGINNINRFRYSISRISLLLTVLHSSIKIMSRLIGRVLPLRNFFHKIGRQLDGLSGSRPTGGIKSNRT